MKLNLEQCIKSGVDQAMNDYELTIEMSIKDAIEKQIPKEPKYDGWLYCPICGRDILMDRFNERNSK